jgi:superfamily II DNA or RNA helicase
VINCKFIHNNRFIDVSGLTDVELEQLTIDNTITWWQFTGYKKKEKKTKLFFNNFKYLPGGFWHRLLFNAAKKNQQLSFQNFNDFQRNITPEDITDWLDTVPFANNYYPYWYQIKALFLAIKYPISRSSLATGAGKTFVMYLLARYLLEKVLHQSKKVLIVVPSIMLVDQTADDFLLTYQGDDYISVDRIYGGSKRNQNANVVIANIDSVVERDAEFFEQFEAVFYDEGHKLATESYQKVFKFLMPNKLKQIYALSGSFYPKQSIEDWTAEAIAGPVMLHVSTNELITGGQLTPIEIICCKFHHQSIEKRIGYYTDKHVNSENKKNYGELNFIRRLDNRIEFIAKVASGLEFNQLLLFKSTEYCKRFMKHVQEVYPHKKCLLIIGEVDAKRRDEIKKYTELNDDILIFATYGTMSTGVSIKNLFALHFVEAAKSFIWVRQSLGRLLRLHPNKTKAIGFDYSDHIELPKIEDYPELNTKLKKTISSKHLKERIRIYTEQKFPFSIRDINFNN